MTTTTRPSFAASQSTWARAAAAVAVAGLATLVSVGAAEASNTAVQTASQRISTVQHVTLARVEIVGRRTKS